MSTPVNDGGSAFPVPPERINMIGDNAHWSYADRGMNLRDYFAAAALQGMIACERVQHDTVQDYARVAYQLADAMLSERQKEVQP